MLLQQRRDARRVALLGNVMQRQKPLGGHVCGVGLLLRHIENGDQRSGASGQCGAELGEAILGDGDLAVGDGLPQRHPSRQDVMASTAGWLALRSALMA